MHNPNTQPIDQVFGLSTPYHLMLKLFWEIKQLEQTVARQETFITESLYHAFNCAITAWHCADWAWHYAVEHQQERQLCDIFEESRQTDEHFFNAVCERSREIAICREIAKGSKHMRIRKPKGEIKTAVEWSFHSDVGTIKLLYVWDGNKSIDAAHLFNKAAITWRDAFSHLGWVRADRPSKLG